MCREREARRYLSAYFISTTASFPHPRAKLRAVVQPDDVQKKPIPHSLGVQLSLESGYLRTRAHLRSLRSCTASDRVHRILHKALH